jgi:uncharacterized protein YigE (DUF2233 family)
VGSEMFIRDSFTTSAESLTFLWKNPETEKPFLTVENVCKFYKKVGKSVHFITNGGIYDKGYKPTGLYIENHQILSPLNLKEGDGNFYLNPNGVFLVTESNNAKIIESSKYHDSLHCKYAVQSGPMLLIDGKIHPKFNPKSKNRRHRSGIGINDKGQVIFLMSEHKSDNYPTFYQFATMFKRLHCKNALFLDGTISMMKQNPTAKEKQSFKFATMIAVIKKHQNKE